MARKRLKLIIAALTATTLCMGGVAPVHAQSDSNSIQVNIHFGNLDLDVDTVNYVARPEALGNDSFPNPSEEENPGLDSSDIFAEGPQKCSGKLTWADMPDFNLTLINANGDAVETINAKNLTTSGCKAAATFSNLSDGTYSLKAQYDNINYALFFGGEKLEGKAEPIITQHDSYKDRQLSKKPIQVSGGQLLKSAALTFTLTHRPLGLKYKTEIGAFAHDGQAVQEAVIYPRLDGEAAQWFKFFPAFDNTATYIGIGAPYGAVPAGPLTQLLKLSLDEVSSNLVSEHKLGQFPGVPQLREDEKQKYGEYKWLGWAAYKWDETEFTEATQLRDKNGEPILYADINNGGKFAVYEDVLFVAKWQKPTRTISFKTASDKGTINGETTVEYAVEDDDSLKDLNKEVPKPEPLPGYEFEGWTIDLSGNIIAGKDIFEKQNTSDIQYYARYRQVPAKECKPGMSSKSSWLIALLPIIGVVVATVIPVVNKFLAGIVDSIKPQALKDFEAWLMQRTGSSVSEEAQAAGTAITASAVLGVLSWWLFSKQEDKC